MERRPASTDPATSERMRGIRRRDTRPEMALRRLLRLEGLHYRCNDRRLPGSPDLVNRKRGWAIFVHGCYWHGHPACGRATTPKRNRDFWIEKILANQSRDKVKVDALRGLGLEVTVVWECEIERMSRDGIGAAPPALVTLLRRLQRSRDRRRSRAG